MKRNPGFILRVAFLIGDLLAIILSFGIAYYYRTHYDPRPYLLGSDTLEFTITMASLLPIWVILLFVSGVYDRAVYPYRPKLYWRLLVVSAVGTMSLITFSYFASTSIFPTRLIALYALIICFILLVIIREFIQLARRAILRRGIGVLNTVVIGNDDSTISIVEQFKDDLESGYRVVGIVAAEDYVPAYAKSLRYNSLADVLASNTKVDVVIQTDEARTDRVYFDTVDHHLSYMFVPSQKALLSRMGEMHIIGTEPVINVRTTPLIGWARVVKRIGDFVAGIISFVIASPFMLIIAVLIKLSEPKAKVIYKVGRLSRFGKEVKIFKFRTMKHEYNNMSPEDAFKKMGKPELAKEYRENGDQLDADPRISKLGRFLRTTSLDELPQLLNVIRGDISLVGPRALVPEELKEYQNKNLILSVKSGLTGLAQVSGRRNISFEERRSLDIYYIQNWSLALDVQIMLKTIVTVLLRRGAR
jgi:exopolysaccharide biosynthesis polyprenyl glycosylphosphotransferase